ncbi:MAG TPA: histidine phosphatase family protein [Candidatus Kryptonia bacterium]|nr:histidine phosphatase family protein [Candidatus Kryptonia bacterium]
MATTGLEERERHLRSNLPLEIVLVRHAEPDWEQAREIGGDPPLTEFGRRQAAQVAQHLAAVPLAAVYCSPLARARETAAAIGAAQQLDTTVVNGLAEIRVGEIRRVSQAEVDAYFTAAARRPFRDYWEGFPGGEPFREFHTRVTGAIESILAHYGARPEPTDGFAVWTAPARAQTLRVGVVAHGGTNGVLLTHLLGIPPVPWEWIRFETPLAAYSVIGLRAVNDQGYVWSLQQFGRRVDGA